MGKGQKLWKRAKELIPGGGMLLSKRPETFLPGLWPAYFTRASGCNVWDLDDRQFIDMSLMGVGTNILGYGNQEVDEAVVKAVTDGNMSTLNCPEEVYLAERLLGMHPWADQCRFARTGGEANAIAVRIARSYTRKSNVAVCGYHGWHDWYLSSNLTEKDNLSKHLLPGLEPAGVPTQLSGTVFPFNYNNMDELLDIVDKNDIGIIKMEVVRNIQPKDNFLGKIRELANSRGIVLIFDECTSGFRESFGGLHKNYDVEPDIAIFGKALGNGYAITAVIGREDIMKEAQSTFISSTFWTERIGPSAALKCLDVMERTKSWETVTKNGEYVRTRWKNLATKHEVPIALHGIPSLTGFKIVDRDALKFKTFITQEMLKKGYLASTSLYLSTAHTKQIIDKYISDLDPIFLKIKEARQNNTIDEMLETTQCHDGFRRLN